ncbi:hypothetical protein CFter6_1495 [Collimonas fungivorans]|jgi:hypothetical protein|uniref:Proline-rich region n=1 Tax=Collimonas fungivorans TaxID=158899 RepID=A0A127P8Q0_9BURK|nr:hypothetical protein [Collimonas fungivorans]AMO94199.1 hypothetical protein CFter6_1495 [Collimonas fungivorans]MDB5765312.1 hypothetical protein [Collimonas fungivorans]
MKKIALLVLAAAGLMVTSSASFAYGYYGHGGFYGPRIGVTIGGPLYWGPPPVYYAPPPVYYAPPPVYVEPEPQTYIEKAPNYAYYCPSPAGYYPQIPRCPKGWMKVMPDQAQPR